PHGITITSHDVVYCTDDKDHTLRKFTLDGKLLQTIGTPHQPSDTGYVDAGPTALMSITRGAGPFNRPTRLFEAANGQLYVTDGYGNARVHCFTAEGKLVRGASRATSPGSSTCRTASGSIPTDASSSATERTTESRSS